MRLGRYGLNSVRNGDQNQYPEFRTMFRQSENRWVRDTQATIYYLSLSLSSEDVILIVYAHGAEYLKRIEHPDVAVPQPAGEGGNREAKGVVRLSSLLFAVLPIRANLNFFFCSH